jgi:hypothetical protein
VTALATTLTTGTLTQDVVAGVISLLTGQLKTDPLMTLELTNFISVIRSSVDTSQFDLALVKAAANGILQGVQLYQQTVSTVGITGAKRFR